MTVFLAAPFCCARDINLPMGVILLHVLVVAIAVPLIAVQSLGMMWILLKWPAPWPSDGSTRIWMTHRAWIHSITFGSGNYFRGLWLFFYKFGLIFFVVFCCFVPFFKENFFNVVHSDSRTFGTDLIDTMHKHRLQVWYQ